MIGKVALCISSTTGNTAKVGAAIREELEARNLDVIELMNHEGVLQQVDADLYIIGFWTRKSTLNDMCKKVVDLYTNRSFLAFGTMGSYPDSEYGDTVRRNVKKYIERKNHCEAAVFLSQGKIREDRTEARRRLPKSAPHYLNDEGYQRHLESRKHPNEDDLQAAKKWIVAALDQVLCAEKLTG